MGHRSVDSSVPHPIPTQSTAHRPRLPDRYVSFRSSSVSFLYAAHRPYLPARQIATITPGPGLPRPACRPVRFLSLLDPVAV